MDSEQVIAPYLEQVAPEHRAAVRVVLLDLLFYIIGHLSVNHMDPLQQALIRNQFIDIVKAACSSPETCFHGAYLALYGKFLVERCPPKKINPVETMISTREP